MTHTEPGERKPSRLRSPIQRRDLSRLLDGSWHSGTQVTELHGPFCGVRGWHVSEIATASWLDPYYQGNVFRNRIALVQVRGRFHDAGDKSAWEEIKFVRLLTLADQRWFVEGGEGPSGGPEPR